MNYKEYLPLFELTDGNRLELTTCRRSDDILFNLCKFENIMGLGKTNFNSEQCFKSISFTHKTRISVNDECMKKRIKTYHKGNVIRLGKNKFDPHSQNVCLCPGMPIICKVNSKKLDIVNNETFTIKKIRGDTIYIKNDEKELNIQSKDFQNIFYLAYCITCHSAQGETFDEAYTIYDFDKMDMRLRYVALTRATDIKYINIV